MEFLPRPELKRGHERRLIDEFVFWLRGQNRDVAAPDYGDAPDAHVAIDGVRTAVELGCGYADDPKELWRQKTYETTNWYSSSSFQRTGRRDAPGHPHAAPGIDRLAPARA